MLASPAFSAPPAPTSGCGAKNAEVAPAQALLLLAHQIDQAHAVLQDLNEQVGLIETRLFGRNSYPEIEMTNTKVSATDGALGQMTDQSGHLVKRLMMLHDQLSNITQDL